MAPKHSLISSRVIMRHTQPATPSIGLRIEEILGSNTGRPRVIATDTHVIAINMDVQGRLLHALEGVLRSHEALHPEVANGKGEIIVDSLNTN